MSHLTTDRPTIFCLDGEFHGLVQKDGKYKYLRLTTANQEYWIKLSKELRTSIQCVPQVGETVQVRGTWKSDRKTGAVQLKADQLIPACAATCCDVPFPEDDRPLTANDARSLLKIMICQKSGCQKKGSSKRYQQLEKVLRDRNLLDRVEFRETGCLGKCSMAPNMVMMPGKKRLSGMSLEAIVEMIERLN